MNAIEDYCAMIASAGVDIHRALVLESVQTLWLFEAGGNCFEGLLRQDGGVAKQRLAALDCTPHKRTKRCSDHLIRHSRGDVTHLGVGCLDLNVHFLFLSWPVVLSPLAKARLQPAGLFFPFLCLPDSFS